MISDEDKKLIQTIVKRTPKTKWGYLLFTFPLFVAILVIAINVGILLYFEFMDPEFAVLFKAGDDITPVWQSELIRRLIGVISFCFFMAFVFFSVLGHQMYKSVRLIKTLSEELKISD